MISMSSKTFRRYVWKCIRKDMPDFKFNNHSIASFIIDVPANIFPSHIKQLI